MMGKKQYLIYAQNHKRLERAKILLGELKAEKPEIIFSDKKRCTIETTVNNHNHRVYPIYLADIDYSVRTVYEDKSHFPSWCGEQSPSLGSHL